MLGHISQCWAFFSSPEVCCPARVEAHFCAVVDVRSRQAVTARGVNSYLNGLIHGADFSDQGGQWVNGGKGACALSSP